MKKTLVLSLFFVFAICFCKEANSQNSTKVWKDYSFNGKYIVFSGNPNHTEETVYFMMDNSLSIRSYLAGPDNRPALCVTKKTDEELQENILYYETTSRRDLAVKDILKHFNQ